MSGDSTRKEPPPETGALPEAALQPVILSSGSGTRLWPLSRRDRPKQFLPLATGRSLFQETLGRASRLPGARPPLVVTTEAYRFLVDEEIREAGARVGGVILEPGARETAPVVAMAALEAARRDPGTLLLVLPTDHWIEDERAFAQSLLQGARAAREGRLVVFGVRPTGPDPGYGYFLVESPSDGTGTVREFVEKPPVSRARELLREGAFWNAGLFLFRADTVLEEFARHAPDILAGCHEALERARSGRHGLRLDPERYARVPAVAFDRAILEKTRRAYAVPLLTGWSDLGSFDRLRALGCDGHGNRLAGNVVADDLHESYVHATSRLVVARGLRRTVVVETADAVLVADADGASDLRDLVGNLEKAGREEATVSPRVHRPWGWYESLARGPSFLVKRIEVRPGASLSLQRHRHRAEHWVVVRGRASVVCEDRRFELLPNQSTFIPQGAAHRLANPGDEPLEIVEVQSGSYIGEDDIERLDDLYGRTEDRSGPPG